MEGVFFKRESAKIYNMIGLISGVFLFLLFGFFICIGAYATLDERIGFWVFACLGLFTSILCGVSLYVNRKVYIHVDEQGISAFCHFGLSLKCGFTDVSSVSHSGTWLMIKLKNGKKYSLMNVGNAHNIIKYIQKRIPKNSMAFRDKDELLESLPPLRKKRKYEMIASVCCFLFLFFGIFLTGALTEWKDLHEFTSEEWVVFAVMICIGIFTVTAACILLRRFFVHTDEMNKNQGALYQTVLLTSPARPGKALKMYVDDDMSVRLTVYGYPNSDEVYFTEEQVNQSYELECIYESEAFSGIDELASEIEGMTEITLP